MRVGAIAALTVLAAVAFWAWRTDTERRSGRPLADMPEETHGDAPAPPRDRAPAEASPDTEAPQPAPDAEPPAAGRFALEGVVLAPDGVTPVDADVHAEIPGDPDDAGQGSAEARAARGGWFRIEVEKPGRYEVVAAPKDETVGLACRRTVDGGDRNVRLVLLPRHVVVLSLRDAAGGRIRGTLVIRSHGPSGPSLRYMGPAPERHELVWRSRSEDRLEISAAGYEAETVPLGPGVREVDVVLRRQAPARLVLHVTLHDGRTPERVRLHEIFSPGLASGDTYDLDAGRLEREVAAGTALLLVDVPASEWAGGAPTAPVVLELDVASGATVRRDVVLPRAARLVFDTGGRATEGRAAFTRDGKPYTHFALRQHPDGGRRIAPGRYAMTLTLRGGGEVTRHFEAHPGATVDVDFGE